MNRPYKKWIQKKPFMLSCITTLITLIIFVLCAGKFSPSTKSNPPLKDFLYVHVGAIFFESCRIPSRVFSSVFSINFLKILLQVFFRYNFFLGGRGWLDSGGGLCWKRKTTKIKTRKTIKIQLLSEKKENNFFFGETKKCSAKMLVGEVVPRKITEEFTFVNRTAV